MHSRYQQLGNTKLRLNSDKTEALLVGTKAKKSSVTVNNLELTDNSIPLSPHAKNNNKKKQTNKPGVSLFDTLTMNEHISSLSRTCYPQLRSISSIRGYLTIHAAAKLATLLTLSRSRLHYCNCLLSCLLSTHVEKLQRIQNNTD